MQAVVEESINPVELRDTYPTMPTGYRLLVALPPKTDKAAKGSIIVAPGERRDINHRYMPVVRVLAMGPDAYGDIEKFPSGPYCKEGDWAQTMPLDGTPFKMDGYGDAEFRIINDDNVLAVAAGPDAVERM